ncbi:MAG: DUF4198 domain-containing protein [Clostridiales bacterium]|nr:DUF4198 domain-containing protein [Clostridiales bacterium]
MKRLQRAVIAILCVVCLAFGVFACGETEDSNEATYTVTVTGGSSMVLRTTTVKLQTESGDDATSAKSLTLNSEGTSGTANFKLKKSKYTVVVDGDFGDLVPLGNTQLTASVRNTTITLGKEEAVKKEYKVRFVYPNGSPVANLTVQICAAQCFPATTDENGWATWNLDADNYEVHVPEENWPNGYYFDDTAYKLTATNTQVIARFAAYTQHTVTVKYASYNDIFGQWMLSEPAANVTIKVSLYDSDKVSGSDTVFATATTDGDGEATFSAPAADLWVEITGGARAGYVQESGISSLIERPAGDEEPAPLTIGLYPAGSTAKTCATLKLDTQTEVSVTSAINYVWYEFIPTQSGTYRLTSTSEFATSCTMPPATSEYVNEYGNNATEEPNSYSEDGNNFTLTFCIDAGEIDESNRWLFKIFGTVESEGTFKVTLTRTGNYEAPKAPDQVSVTAEEVTAVANQPAIPAESNFKFLNYETDSTTKGADGYYHLYTADGDIVYASIGGKYSPAGISGGFQGVIESPTGTQSITLTDGKTYNYEYTNFIKEYIKNLNADGLHPLNDELKTFLELFGKAQLNRNDKSFYACGYYASIYSQLIGGSMVQTGDYKFEVAAGETKTLTYTPKNYMDTNPAVITVTSGNVKLLDKENQEAAKLTVTRNEQFSVKNDGATTATVILHVEYKTADAQINAIGEYLVIASEWGTEYAFTAPETDKYTFVLSEGDISVVNDEENPNYGEPIALNKNDKITLIIYTPMGVSEDEIVTLTIAIYEESETPTPGGNTLSIGANSVTGTYDIDTDSGTTYTFTATDAGDYTITVSHDGYVVIGEDMLDGTEENGNSTTIHLEAGQTISLDCTPSDFDADTATFTITITKA